MNRNNFIFIFILLFAFVAAFVFFSNMKKESNPEQVTSYAGDVFTFEEGDAKFTVQYADEGDKAQLSTSGAQYELEQSISASGAKYESTDGSVVFWEHQGEASLTVNGEPVYTEAKLLSNTKDTPSISLENTKWQWKETIYSNVEEVTPKQSDAFTLAFMKDGRFAATTDCNNLMGSYVSPSAEGITFSQMASTMMFCEDSQEIVFSQMLAEVSDYQVNDSGQLVLTLKEGSMVFEPVAL